MSLVMVFISCMEHIELSSKLNVEHLVQCDERTVHACKKHGFFLVVIHVGMFAACTSVCVCVSSYV